MFYARHKKNRVHQNRGFTIVEMLVVTGIFAVLTAIVVFRYGDFTSNLLVTNMAYEIALQVRQAQVFGLGARGSEEAGNAVFTRPYGVHINMFDGSTGDPSLYETKRIQFFVDRNEDTEPGYGQCSNFDSGTYSGICDCTNDECTEQLTLQRNIKITEIKTDALGEAGDVCEADDVPQIAITFERPSPEARIERQASGSTGYEFVQIKVEVPGSDVAPAYVLVRQSGQISVSGDDICTTVN